MAISAIEIDNIDIGISQTDREKIATELAILLANTFVVYYKTHQFHWNVTGTMFNTLHTLFEEQYTELWNATDSLAERIRSIGAYAPGSFKQLTEMSNIKETVGVPSAMEMIQILVDGHEALIQQARSIMPIVEKASDESTADLITERLQVHEKTAWMLRSFLA